MVHISGCDYTSVGRGRKSRSEWQINAQPGFFSPTSLMQRTVIQRRRRGEGEVCVLSGSSISALHDKMGETEENVEDFRAIADIYIRTLSVIRSSLTPALWLLWLLSHSMTLSNRLTIC